MITLDGAGIWQWDLNRTVTVDTADEVHFAMPGDSEALVVLPTASGSSFTANIPNVLLQRAGALSCWRVVDDVSVQMTRIEVKPRPQPSDYIYEETELIGYLPLNGGELAGSLTINTGTNEPNMVLKRTVDGVPCELIARIDSDAVAGLRYKVNGAVVNDLYLEQTKTRLKKPLDPDSGGVPTAGTAGQVLTKGETGAEWKDLPEVVQPTADTRASRTTWCGPPTCTRKDGNTWRTRPSRMTADKRPKGPTSKGEKEWIAEAS